MDTNYLPLWKTLESPLVALDESHVELFSVLALFLLTLLVLNVRRHRQGVRHLVQGLAILVFFYIVYSCLGVFGMIRNTLHGITLIGTVFTESFFWMSLPVVVLSFALMSGPFFCGWICPTGTLQEIMVILRENLGRLGARVRLRPGPATRNVLLFLFFAGFMLLVFWMGSTRQFYVEDSSLYWGASLFLLLFLVLSGVVRDEAIRGLRAASFWIIVISALLRTTIVSPVHFAFADVRDPASALTTLVLMVASLFLARAWCRYICPWGYLMGLIHRRSRLRVQAEGECRDCGVCARVCRVGAIQAGRVRLDQCQFCLACVDRCPQGRMKVVDTWQAKTDNQCSTS
ncbi:MAG: 4Fe-4S binding protein [Myxococcales bacterium]|nr:4Fe-4S binding protein [Myxococcales bacterium]